MKPAADGMRFVEIELFSTNSFERFAVRCLPLAEAFRACRVNVRFGLACFRGVALGFSLAFSWRALELGGERKMLLRFTARPFSLHSPAVQREPPRGGRFIQKLRFFSQAAHLQPIVFCHEVGGLL